MEKLLILFLSIFISQNCLGQTQTIDCFNTNIQDSLVTRYMNNGAFKYGYNHPKWGIYCDSLIAICPNIALPYREKAIPYIKSGDFGKAFPLEDRAVEIEPKKWLDYRAFLKCIFSKDYNGAIQDFEIAQKQSPNGFIMDHSYQFYLGLCYLELKDLDNAEENLKKDILIQTKGDTALKAHFNSYLYLGIIYLEKQNYKNAELFLQESLKQFSQMPDANYYLAMTYKALGKQTEKRKYIEIAQATIKRGLGLSEDNEIYTNYPHQITIYEIEKELNE